MTQLTYTAFDKKTGAVSHCGQFNVQDAEHYSAPGCIIVGGWYDPDLYYMDVETGLIHERVRFQGFVDDYVAVGDVFQANGIPEGTQVQIDGGPWSEPINDGSIEIEPQHVGTFHIGLRGPRIIKWQGVVDAY